MLCLPPRLERLAVDRIADVLAVPALASAWHSTFSQTLLPVTLRHPCQAGHFSSAYGLSHQLSPRPSKSKTSRQAHAIDRATHHWNQFERAVGSVTSGSATPMKTKPRQAATQARMAKGAKCLSIRFLRLASAAANIAPMVRNISLTAAVRALVIIYFMRMNVGQNPQQASL